MGGLQLLQESSYKGFNVLKCHSIQKRIEKAGQLENVQAFLSALLIKTSALMGIDTQSGIIQIFVSEIIECYKHESIEDIQQAMIRGRRGEFEKTHAKRGSLSMELIDGWIKAVLSEKSRIREDFKRQESKLLQEDQSLLELDYGAYKDRQEKAKKHIQEMKDKFNIQSLDRIKQIETNKKIQQGKQIIKKYGGSK